MDDAAQGDTEVQTMPCTHIALLRGPHDVSIARGDEDDEMLNHEGMSVPQPFLVPFYTGVPI